MPIISRRISLLMLSIAFFLLLAPVISAQDAGGGEYRNIWPQAIQWGIGGIMFTVWLYQFKKSKQGDENVVKLFTDQLATQNETTKLAFEKYNERTDQLLQLLKASHEANVQAQKDSQSIAEHLAGTLGRLEAKLQKPVICPLNEFSQITGKGAQG